jgi:hypothetical protein
MWYRVRKDVRARFTITEEHEVVDADDVEVYEPPRQGW